MSTLEKPIHCAVCGMTRQKQFDKVLRHFDVHAPTPFCCVSRTLVVGQWVSMSSGCYYNRGKVVRVTPEGVEVQANFAVILRFDNEGKGRPGSGTFECGPWFIDDMLSQSA
jgi:hypothetical protein